MPKLSLPGDGGGSLAYRTDGEVDSDGDVVKYEHSIYGYVDRLWATYRNHDTKSAKIEVVFAVPSGATVVKWKLPPSASRTKQAPQSVIASVPDGRFDQQNVLSRQDEFDFHSFDLTVPGASGSPGVETVSPAVIIDSERGKKNDCGVWVNGSFAGGSGTSSDPYQIENWTHLNSVRDDLSASYELTATLDSETSDYVGIGDSFDPIAISSIDGTPFTGVFDGQGYALRDLIIKSAQRGTGLFGGADAIIQNLAVGGTVTATDGNSEVGGVVGRFDGGTIEKTVSDITVNADNPTNVASAFVGGLVGQNLGTVRDSYALGAVNGGSSASIVGGLIGSHEFGSPILENSFATGAVSGGDDVGGLIGRNRDSGGTVTDSYWDVESTGQSTSAGNEEGGIGLTTSELQGDEAATNLSGFDFSATWETVTDEEQDTGGDGYPILRGINRPDQLRLQALYDPTLRRTVATGSNGASVSSRTLVQSRSVNIGATGASSVSRRADLSRVITTGSTGQSMVSRRASLRRSATTGDTGASRARRAYLAWRLADQEISPSTDIEVTASTLTLSFEVSRSDIDRWRVIGDFAGNVTTQEAFGGVFRSISRGGESIGVEPAAASYPPISPSNLLIVGYQETQLAPDRYAVSFTLQRKTNRGEDFPELAQAGGDWTITLQHGTLALSETQVGQADREGAPAGATLTLPLRVSDKQAAALLDNLGYPAGIVERSVPDGPNQRVDETGGRQTIDVDAPAGAAIDSGEWYVTDWSLSFNSYSEGRTWLFELALAE